jgi:tRNA nucleotidyltransferase/poly(A) polymerase
VDRAIEDFVRTLGLDAYLVGGAVRDEQLGLESKDADFVVPGVDYDGLRRALEPHGRVEDLEVADRQVGARLHPNDPELRRLAPAGIEFAPPRAELSTGPGRHDFEIVADPSLSIEGDMARRDFTVNAMARRLDTGELVDPFGGRADLERGVLRMVRPNSFAEDPLRLVRGLRLVSHLGLEPEEDTLEHMRAEAGSIRLVSGERLGDELAKLLQGKKPAKALRLARDTGVLTALLPEFEPAIGSVDEHIFRVVQAAADAGAPLAVRLAALFHDLGKPSRNGSHAERSAALASGALGRLRYPNRLRAHTTRLVRAHSFPLEDVDALFARRFLRDHGDVLAFDLVTHKEADLAGKRPSEEELAAVAQLRSLLEQERAHPHRLSDLAVDGADLIALGFEEGPELGRILTALLDAVVEDPRANTTERLLALARDQRR